MKLKQNSESTTKQRSSIARSIGCLAVGLIAALQMGCSSTGSATQQVSRPQTQAPGFYSNPAWANPQGQSPFNQASPYGGSGGGSGTSFQGNPYGGGSGTSFQANRGGGSGTTFQANPNGQFGFNGGGSGTSFQASSGSGTRSQFGAGFPNFQQQQQYFQSGYNPQSGFNPFGYAKTSC